MPALKRKREEEKGKGGAVGGPDGEGKDVGESIGESGDEPAAKKQARSSTAASSTAPVTAGSGRAPGDNGVEMIAGKNATEEKTGNETTVVPHKTLDHCKYKYAMICSSNVNRSMEAHKRLQEYNFDVESFGVGSQVRMPGKRRNEPSLFPFGTKYSTMLSTLKSRDEEFFRSKGIIQMLERNVGIKDIPERWQEYQNIAKFDLVVCFEERVFDILVEDLFVRLPQDFRSVHVINIETRDNQKASKISGGVALDFSFMCERASNLDWEISDIISAIETKYDIKILHAHALL